MYKAIGLVLMLGLSAAGLADVFKTTGMGPICFDDGSTKAEKEWCESVSASEWCVVGRCQYERYDRPWQACYEHLKQFSGGGNNNPRLSVCNKSSGERLCTDPDGIVGAEYGNQWQIVAAMEGSNLICYPWIDDSWTSATAPHWGNLLRVDRASRADDACSYVDKTQPFPITFWRDPAEWLPVVFIDAGEFGPLDYAAGSEPDGIWDQFGYVVGMEDCTPMGSYDRCEVNVHWAEIVRDVSTSPSDTIQWIVMDAHSKKMYASGCTVFED